jgi:hypothetical protein
VRGTNVTNIIASITVAPNRPQLLRALESGHLPFLLSDGVKRKDEKTTIERVSDEPKL